MTNHFVLISPLVHLNIQEGHFQREQHFINEFNASPVSYIYIYIYITGQMQSSYLF